MKNFPLLFTVLLFTLLHLKGQAQDRFRVNNTGASTSFTDLAAAIAGVAPDDILIVEHSDTKYGISPTDVNQLLTIYGTGYYLEDNDSTQADIRTSSVGTLNITTDGVTISGITADTIKINANDVIVERCLILEHLVIGDELATVDAPIVRQCFIEGSATNLVQIDNGTNFIFSNNFLNNTDLAGTNNLVMALGTSGLILNNLFFGEADNVFRNASISNNYFEKSEIDVVTSSNITVKGNYAEGTFLEALQGIGFGNSFAPDTMFRPPVGSRDKRYELRPLVSPGLDAGLDGKDIGLFGGSYPYVPSGMPPIPSIWFKEQNDAAPENGTIDVVVKSKSHK